MARTGRLYGGRKAVTTAGTQVQLEAGGRACLEVTVCAALTNTGTITVGDSSVDGASATRTGIPLAAGEKWVLPVNDLSEVWVDSTVNGEAVTFVAVIL